MAQIFLVLKYLDTADAAELYDLSLDIHALLRQSFPGNKHRFTKLYNVKWRAQGNMWIWMVLGGNKYIIIDRYYYFTK